MSPSPSQTSRPRAGYYRESLGARVSPPSDAARAWRDGGVRRTAEHEGRIAQPLGADSPIAQVSARTTPTAACTISASRSTTSSPRAINSTQAGARVLGDGAPKIGAHGKPVLFLHPKDFNGTLIELEQV